MFQKIRHKLFLAILLANGMLLLVVYLSANWIFDTSFREYLDQSEAERLSPLVEELAVLFQRHRHWRWIRDRSDSTWPELMQRYAVGRSPGPGRRYPGFDRPRLPPGGFNPDRRRRTGGFDPDRRRPAGGFDPARKPPPAAIPLGIRPGLLLRDADNNLIIGRPDAQADAYWIAINSAGNVVGYLGFLRRLEINSDLDSLFSKRVENYLAWLLLGVLAITGLVAIPLAGGLVGSIEKLRIAFHQLASGNYQLSLEKQSNDEIGDLQEDFNRLARTMRKNLEARQRWIADISHELRTPIAVLQGEVEAIIDGVRDVDSASIKSLHQEILRLSRLLDDLHELSLSDLGAMSYHNKSIDIRALLGSILYRPTRAY